MSCAIVSMRVYVCVRPCVSVCVWVQYNGNGFRQVHEQWIVSKLLGRVNVIVFAFDYTQTHAHTYNDNNQNAC